jgi:T-complex protein 1 subunit zeta
MSGGLAYLNPGGMQARKATALQINLGAARGLQEVMKTNLGPRGTMKMLVSGAGLIKITKDGNTLLGEMQIQHPTASLIARAATATDDETGDGSTSTVLVIGEQMRQCESQIVDGLHPRLLTEGFDIARQEILKQLPNFAVEIPAEKQREFLYSLAHTTLSTKIPQEHVAGLSEACVQAVLSIIKEGEPIDLHMVEVMHMRHRMGTETTFINGIVLDHGARSDSMPKSLENCYILTCNIPLEWERSELASGFYYNDPKQKAKMAEAERAVTDRRTQAIIDLKNAVCTKENGKSFVVINQNGIDPIALEMLSRAGIFALRRAKRRNMERLTKACGGEAVNSAENLTADVLGFAQKVWEQTLGDEKYTFVEGCPMGRSCTLLVKGQNDHTIAQIKDAIRDGLRAVKNGLEDKKVLPGAGALEIACHDHLIEFSKTVIGRQKLGVRAFAEALLIIPKTLAENSGLDVQATLISLQEAYQRVKGTGNYAGLSVETGEVIDPVAKGIIDNVAVKKSLLETTGVIASQLLLVDEIMKAGRRGHGAPPSE